MGQDDTLNFVLINNTANVINTCKLFIYKWYKWAFLYLQRKV